MHLFKVVLPLFATSAWAWLPSDRNLFDVSHPSGASNTYLPAGNGRIAKRTLPSFGKIRGVNLGSLFVLEPWMASKEWSIMGCNGTNSEFDCVSKLGQAVADSAFQAHWARFITKNDVIEMKSLSLNTIRIPVGFWMMESLVDASESFPRGGIKYLEKVCGWAADYGIYVIIDLHGAPFAQVARQSFTGQIVQTEGFYTTSGYDRSSKFLAWMANIIHTNTAYRTVGTLQVLNEPISDRPTLISEFYPKSYAAIRAAESAISVSPANQLHVQFMSKSWRAGDPQANLPSNASSIWFDSHRYVKWDTSVALNQTAYINASCTEDLSVPGETNLVIGEWSLSVANDVENTPAWGVRNSTAHYAFYEQWFKAQTIAYEKQAGWIFWSWKAELGDWRWSYRDAVNEGIIPKDLDQIYSGDACDGGRLW
ncbi:glycoside hydrolase family 5 protein [Venturia nashicola]|uniref:glucan endo-1,6-beta-glucosidase n=1 Tax=Venturia nashicola TaxID=86259 RepID=A0A4Z1PEY2_9PEZI|nr:glycoside hydrolase family 5 protein [Venturia nashicola]